GVWRVFVRTIRRRDTVPYERLEIQREVRPSCHESSVVPQRQQTSFRQVFRSALSSQAKNQTEERALRQTKFEQKLRNLFLNLSWRRPGKVFLGLVRPMPLQTFHCSSQRPCPVRYRSGLALLALGGRDRTRRPLRVRGSRR